MKHEPATDMIASADLSLCQIKLSRHAGTRCQQRGIRGDLLKVLIAFGKIIRRGGADVYYMDKRARRDVERYLGRETYRRLADRLNTYLVVGDDGAIITAAPRLKRMKF